GAHGPRPHPVVVGGRRGAGAARRGVGSAAGRGDRVGAGVPAGDLDDAGPEGPGRRERPPAARDRGADGPVDSGKAPDLLSGPGASPSAVAVGFEPTVGGCPTKHFECFTFGRSDTPP